MSERSDCPYKVLYFLFFPLHIIENDRFRILHFRRRIVIVIVIGGLKSMVLTTIDWVL